MKNAIENRIPIHIDLAPNRDEMYSGISLKSNRKINILVSYNEEDREFDGYAIIRDYEINKFRYWDDAELGEIQNNNYKDFENKLPINKMKSFFDCLFHLKDKALITIFTEEDDESFYVGRIEELSEKEVNMKLMNESAEWVENYKIAIDQITYIGFDSSFENDLIKA